MERNDLAFVCLLAIFAYGMFSLASSSHVRPYAYGYALEVRDAAAGKESDIFALASASVYSSLYGEFSAQGFTDFASIFVPILGVVSTVLIFLAARSKFDALPSLLAAAFFAASPPILLNSLPGAFTPQIAGTAVLSLSLALLFISKERSNILLTLLSGLVAAAASALIVTGILFPLVVSACFAVWVVVLRASHKPIRKELILTLAFAVPSLSGAFYLTASIPEAAFDLGLLVSNASLFLPLATVSFIVSLYSVLRGKSSEDENLFALLFAGAFYLGGFDITTAIVLFAIPTAHGASTLVSFPSSKQAYLSAVFAVLLSFFAFYLNSSSPEGSYLGLAILIAVAAAGVLSMYDRENWRSYISFCALSLAFFLVAYNALLMPSITAGIEDYWPGAFAWISANATSGSIASVSPQGMIEFETGVESCDCETELAKYLLSSGDASSLKEKGVGYVVFERKLIFNMGLLTSLAGDSEARIEVYGYAGHTRDELGNWQALYVSESGSVLYIPVNSFGAPLGDDVYISDIGQISFGRLKYLGNSTMTTDPNLVFLLPIRGADSNLFRILVGSPLGLTKVYEGEGITVYSVD